MDIAYDTPSLLATNISNAGLGNRMRFTLSALSLADSAGRSFQYAWPQTDMFKPPLNDLWKFEHTEITWAQAQEISKHHPPVPKGEKLNSADTFWHLRSGDAVTLPDGAPTWSERFRQLVPSEAIQKKVSSTFEELRGAPYVGVSIRAHAQSHAKTKEASPVEWYVRRMEALAQEVPGVAFFISCDVPEVQERLVAKFPHSVGLTDKGGYNSTEGVMAGVVDLYLLASSSYMLVPYWSSFPTMAWELADRKIPMENSRGGRRDIEITDVPLAVNPLRPAMRQ